MRVFGLFSIELVNFEAISFTAGLLVLERAPVLEVLTLELAEFVDVVDADDCMASEWLEEEAFIFVFVEVVSDEVVVSLDVFESTVLSGFSFACFDLLSSTYLTR
jgi:hypothetical protein